MQKHTITWNKQKLSFILAFIPFLILVGLVISAAVNVPYYDQWNFVPLIQHVRSGHFYFNDFWHQFNEHRVFFPRIVLITLAFLTHWNTRAESFLGLVIAGISFVFIIKIVALTRKKQQGAIFFLPLLLSLIWFSPDQFENWIWGWQVTWFLNILGISIVAYGIARIKDRELTNSNLVIMLAAGLLAHYSLGNGVLIWPLLVAALLYKRVPISKTLVTAATGVMATIFYYINYFNPDPGLSHTRILQQPMVFVAYVFSYLGRPLDFLTPYAPILGLYLLILFFGTLTYLFIKKRDVFSALLPWTVLGLYAFGSAVVTAEGRLQSGYGHAFHTRYVTCSNFFLISTVMIVLACKDILKKRFGNHLKFIAIGAVSVLLLLVFTNAANGISNMYYQKKVRTGLRSCSHRKDPADKCLQYLYPDTRLGKNDVIKRINYLKQIHWGGY